MLLKLYQAGLLHRTVNLLINGLLHVNCKALRLRVMTAPSFFPRGGGTFPLDDQGTDSTCSIKHSCAQLKEVY